MGAGGQPTKYREKYCEMLYQHMAGGLSFESFAGVIRVNRDTLYEWCKHHAKFSDAKTEGRAAGLLYWEELAREAVRGGIPNFNATVWVFTMKNRFQWRDRQPDEIEASKLEPTILELPNSGKTILISSKKKKGT